MDKDLQTALKELCEILEPMNIKLGLLIGNAYAVYILIDDLLRNADET